MNSQRSNNSQTNNNSSNLSNEKYWDVEALLKSKYIGTTKFYYVKWVGYSHKHNTWEPESNIKNINHYLQFFENQQRQATIQRHQKSIKRLKRKKDNKTTNRLKHNIVETDKQELNQQSRISKLDLKEKHPNKNKNIRKLCKRSLKQNIYATVAPYQFRNSTRKNQFNIDKQMYLKKSQQKPIDFQEIPSSKLSKPKKQAEKKIELAEKRAFYQPNITKQYEKILLQSKVNQQLQYSLEQEMQKYVNNQMPSEQQDSNIPSQIVQKIIGTNDHSKKIYQVYLFNGQLAEIHQEYLKKYFSKQFCQYFLNRQSRYNYL